MKTAPLKFWLAFRDTEPDDVNTFEFNGLFSTREAAIAACKTPDDWITEEVLDVDLTEVDSDFDKFYPLVKAEASE